MKDVGVPADKENLKQMLALTHGKKVSEHIRNGESKMASMPSGGAASSAPAASSGAPAAKAEVKEEAKKEEEADVDMGDLFGGGDY